MRPIILRVSRARGGLAPVGRHCVERRCGTHVRVRVALTIGERPAVPRLGTPSELSGMKRLDLLVGEAGERTVVDLGEIADDYDWQRQP